MQDYENPNAFQVQHSTDQQVYSAIPAVQAQNDIPRGRTTTESIESKITDEGESIEIDLMRWEDDGGACCGVRR